MIDLANKRLMRTVLASSVCVGILAGTAEADSILLGADYTTKRPGVRPPQTFLDLSEEVPGIGVVRFNVDRMILLRLEDASLPFVGATDSVDIEFAALELRHRSRRADLQLTLDSSQHSLGVLNVVHEFADNPALAGTYGAFINVFFTLTGRYRSQIISQTGHFSFVSGGSWTHEPPPGTKLVEGAPGDQLANWHVPKPPGFSDFFMVDTPLWERTDGIGQLGGPVLLPAPPSSVLLISGLVGVVLTRRMRRGPRSETVR
jgi:hypothetical protein